MKNVIKNKVCSKTDFIKQEQGYSRRLQMIFDEIGFKKTKTVLTFWNMMVDVYHEGMCAFYGDEPNEQFVQFAVKLTRKDMQRIYDNVHHSLYLGHTFTPTVDELKGFWQRPTRNEVNTAIRDLFTSPKPLKYLNRVNKYLIDFHSDTMRSFKKETFEVEFKKFYEHWWREVTVFNIDLLSRSQQNALGRRALNTKDNWFDEKIKADLESGRAFDHPFGERIIEIMASKKKDRRGEKFG